MNDQQYNAILRILPYLRYQSLFKGRYYGIDDFYVTFSISDIQLPDDSIEVINKLKGLKANQFYSEDYIGPSPHRKKYFDFYVVKEFGEEIGFHPDTSFILFNYLTWRLQHQIEFFLKTLEDGEFIKQISGDIKQDDNDFIEFYKSPKTLELLKAKLSDEIEDPVMIIHFLRELYRAVTEYQDYICFHKYKIRAHLNDLDNYTFEDVSLI